VLRMTRRIRRLGRARQVRRCADARHPARWAGLYDVRVEIAQTADLLQLAYGELALARL
jgi:hypothetical protein